MDQGRLVVTVTLQVVHLNPDHHRFLLGLLQYRLDRHALVRLIMKKTRARRLNPLQDHRPVRIIYYLIWIPERKR